MQDGPDHVDSHRGTIFFAGPYVKKGGEVVNTRYSQVNLLRTIEDLAFSVYSMITASCLSRHFPSLA